ncbi:DMT family transporter [Algirhabdus cladophorae]|uniref:DMT family transporter n=1 Tax=Algirhabdus cladophorae TaxID=3377108 RepID=UPI003B84A8D4
MSDTLRGILLMTASMAGFAMSDMLIKLASQQLANGYIILIMGLGGVAVFYGMARRAGIAIWTGAFFNPAVVVRNTSEIIGVFGMITALSLIPLTTISILIQATPIIVTLGAAVILGAPVGPWRWGAILVGFFGVVLIINPTQTDLDPNLIYGMIAVLGLAGRDLATRKVPKSIPSLAVATYGFLIMIPLGLILIAADPAPAQFDGRAFWLMLATLLFAMAGNYAITAAMRIGDIAAVTPFRYSRILFGVGLGMLVFGEKLTVSAIIGVLIVISAGLFIVLRERRHSS